MDMKLFDSYKVASRLPYDIFKTICLKAVQTEVSDFAAEDQNTVQKIIGSDVNFDENENYYRTIWKYYLDNE